MRTDHNYKNQNNDNTKWLNLNKPEWEKWETTNYILERFRAIMYEQKQPLMNSKKKNKENEKKDKQTDVYWSKILLYYYYYI